VLGFGPPRRGNNTISHVQSLMLGRSRKMAANLQDRRISGQRRSAEGANGGATVSFRRLVSESLQLGKRVEQNGE